MGVVSTGLYGQGAHNVLTGVVAGDSIRLNRSFSRALSDVAPLMGDGKRGYRGECDCPDCTVAETYQVL